MRTAMVAGGAALLALSATACGRMGELEPPSARETQRAPRDAGAAGLPEPATINRPPTQQPIDGTASNPFGGSGAYPEDRPDAR